MLGLQLGCKTEIALPLLLPLFENRCSSNLTNLVWGNQYGGINMGDWGAQYGGLGSPIYSIALGIRSLYGEPKLVWGSPN